MKKPSINNIDQLNFASRDIMQIKTISIKSVSFYFFFDLKKWFLEVFYWYLLQLQVNYLNTIYIWIVLNEWLIQELFF